MDSFDRFEETSLTPREAFFNTLTDSEITDEAYEHASRVCNIFKCETMRDYHSIYLKCDVALICDIFEHFSDIACKDYKFGSKTLYHASVIFFRCNVEINTSRTGTSNLLSRLSLRRSRIERWNFNNHGTLCP